MEAFNQHLSAQPFAARLVEMVMICLTLFMSTAMVSAKLHTRIFVVCLILTFNIILHVKCILYFATKRSYIAGHVNFWDSINICTT